MIYQETIDFLSTRFPKKRELEKFSSVDTQALYARLHQHASKEEVLANRGELRRAFLDYCNDTNRCVVLFRGLETITVKLTPMEPINEASETFKALVSALKGEENAIFSASGREDILVVAQPLVDRLREILRSHQPPVDPKEALRRAVRQGFNLSPKDAVIFLGGQIYVRIFVSPQKRVYGRVDRRFGGLPPEELERLKHAIFKESVATTLQGVMDELVQNELNFSQVTNDAFEKSALVLIQSKIVDFLQSRMEEDHEVLEAFGAYLLRENFQMIHEELAQALLEKAMAGDEGAERFIKHFSGDVAVQDGQKYQLPEIVDRHEMRWNFSTIKAIASQFYRDRDQIESRMEQVQLTRDEYAGIDDEIAQARLALEKAKKEQLSVKITVEENGNALAKLREALAEARKEAARKGESDEVKASIANLNNQIREATAKDEGLFKERSRADIRVKECEKQLETLERKKLTLERKLKEDENRLKEWMKGQQEMIDKYETMVEALARALMKKKIKI